MSWLSRLRIRLRIWWLERGYISPEHADTQQTREARILRLLIDDARD